MKAYLKIFALLAVPSLLLIGLFGLWMFHVPSYNLAEVEQIRAAVLGRMTAREKTPPDQNGYTLLAPALARKAPVTLVAPYQNLGQLWTNPTTTLDTLPRSTEAVTAFLKDFEKVEPNLLSAASRPVFAWPTPLDQGFNREQPDLNVLKAMNESLAVRGLLFEMEKKTALALDRYLAILRLGVLVRKAGSLAPLMIGTDITRTGSRSLLHLLTGPALTAADLAKASDALAKLQDEKSDYVNAIDEQFVDEDHTMELLGSNSLEAQQALKTPFHVPAIFRAFYFGRERRLAGWQLERYRRSEVELKTPKESGVDLKEDRAYFRTHLALQANLLPNLNQTVLVFARAQTELNALKIVAALQAWHQEKKTWPDDLKQLFKEVPRDCVSADGNFVYRLDRGEPYLASQSPKYKDALKAASDVEQFLPYQEEAVRSPDGEP